MDQNINKVKRCCGCVMPETEGHVDFNENGMCTICSQLKDGPVIKKDGEEKDRLDILKRKVDKFRVGGKYDCAVSVSGGKDSVMALYIAKKVLGLNPLAIFIDNGFALPEMYENIQNATDILKVDFIIHKTHDCMDIFKYSIESQKEIYYCRVCHALIDLTIRDICKKYGIRLILGGYTKGQQYIRNNELFWIYDISDESIKEVLRELPQYEHLVELFDNQTAYFGKHYKEIVQLSPFRYMKWQEDEIVELLSKELKFKKAKNSWPENSSNCTFNYVAQYLALKTFGYAQHEVELSNLVRVGEMSRERALDIVETPLYADIIEATLDKMGIDIQKFEKAY